MNLLLVVSTYLFVGVMVNAQASPIASASNGTHGSAEKELISLARARANAFASGNCKTLMRYYPRDFRIIEADAAESRDSLLQECENNKILPGHSQRRIVSDFHFRLLGDVALLDYQYETIDRYGRVSFTNIDRQVDTYQKRNGTWDLVLVVDSRINRDPPVVKAHASAYGDFVGKYGWVGAPGMVDTVTQRGGKLYLQTTGGGPAELLPASADAFFIHGGLDRYTFVRDKTGRVVTEYDRSPDGDGLKATRIR